MLRQRLGLGFTEYRIMVMLSLEPGIAAKRIGEVVGLDKAAISRGVGTLEAAHLIEPTPETAGRRSQAFRLTAKGEAVYARATKVGREHERLLMADLSADEQRALWRPDRPFIPPKMIGAVKHCDVNRTTAKAKPPALLSAVCVRL